MTKPGFNLMSSLHDQDWLKDRPKHPFDTFLVNPADRPALFRTSRLTPPSAKWEPGDSAYLGDIFGMEVHTSELVPPGKVVMIERPEFKPFTYEPIKSPWVDRIYSELSDIIRNRIASAFGVPGYLWDYNPPVVPYKWQQFKGETVFAWGERLSTKGLLDDPEIRWEFQKAVWKSIGLKLKRMVGR